MTKHERVGIVLMLAGLISVFGPAVQPPDLTMYEIMQLLLGYFILVVGAVRFIWSEDDDEQ